MTLDEIQALLNQRAHVRIWYNHTAPDSPPAFEGHIVGLYDHPTIVVQDADGNRYTVSSQLRIETTYPPEPVDGYYLDRDGDVWWRFDDAVDEEERWGHQEIRKTWADLNRTYGPLTRLIPDPATNMPDLPWACFDEDGDRLRIMPLTGNHVEVSVTVNGHYRTVNIEPEVAEVAAGALLRAAREARQP